MLGDNCNIIYHVYLLADVGLQLQVRLRGSAQVSPPIKVFHACSRNLRTSGEIPYTSLWSIALRGVERPASDQGSRLADMNEEPSVESHQTLHSGSLLSRAE